jgi:predicted RNA-binding Zn-ribbon protein involved in translation (DUF1610 family)
VPTTPEYAAQLVQVGITDCPPFHHVPNGCDLCDHTGYKGRIGVYEMLMLDGAVRAAIREHSANDEVRALAHDAGMLPMQEYALDHVRSGLTTLDEAQRVVPFDMFRALQCSSCQRELSSGFTFCPHCGERQTYEKSARTRRAAEMHQGVRAS